MRSFLAISGVTQHSSFSPQEQIIQTPYPSEAGSETAPVIFPQPR